MTKTQALAIVSTLAIGCLFISGFYGDRNPAFPLLAASAAASTITFEYDCAAVPWSCEGARSQKRWQAWEVRCPASGCVWRWLKRAVPPEHIDVLGSGTYRLFFGGDNDFDNIADFRLNDTPLTTEIYLDIVYQCTRFPFLCDGESAWQLYRCSHLRDNSCNWEWDSELVGNASGVFTVLELDDYLLYWGKPRGRLETPMPSPSPTVTRTPTMTRTSTPAPSATIDATLTPTRPPTSTTIPTATPIKPHIYLPMSAKRF